MTEISAVNKCLRAIGEAPLPTTITLDDLEPENEASIIRTILQEHSRDLQGRGWWFNKQSWTFAPEDITKRINVADNVISFKTEGERYIVVGRAVFDKTNQTFEFEDNLRLKAMCIFEVLFEDLPYNFASYVVQSACIDCIRTFIGRGAVDDYDMRKLSELKSDVEREHTNYRESNFITGNRPTASRDTEPTGVV